MGLSDQHVKMHAQFLCSMRLPLVVALVGTVGLLHLSGAFAAPRERTEATVAASNRDVPMHPSTAFLRPQPAAVIPPGTEMNDPNADDAERSTRDPYDADDDGVADDDDDADGVEKIIIATADLSKYDLLNAATESPAIDEGEPHEEFLTPPTPGTTEYFTDDSEQGVAVTSGERVTDGNSIVDTPGPACVPISFQFKSHALSFADSVVLSRVKIDGLGKRVAHVAKFLAFQADKFKSVAPSEVVLAEDDRPAITNNIDGQIVIRNSSKSQNSVAFVVGKKDVRQLKPGETLALPADSNPTVRFHRGGEFGNASATLTAGTFEFQATNRGWYLEPIESDSE